MIRLKRVSEKPILEPEISHPWEASAVFNCAAIYDNGLVHMIYRATDLAPNGKEGKFVSRLGYAVSRDGINFNRLKNPLLTNDVPQEKRGLEDPRIVKIDGIFYMMYTGYRGELKGDYRICLASSTNLIDWKRHGVVLDESNKDGSLFPEKINGRYVMLHRREPDIWIAYSNDLITWYNHTKIMGPIPSSKWENLKIGISGPPIKTKDGWILLYHGVSNEHIYSQGIALLDLENPDRVLARQTHPILKPELSWEKTGHIPDVVFSCGQVELDDRIIVYYCGADTVIGAAELSKKDIVF